MISPTEQGGLGELHMTSFGKRLLLTCTAIPLLFSLIFFLPHYHHLGFTLLTLLAILCGSYEMRDMLFHIGEKPMIPTWIPILLPATQYVELAFLPEIPLLDITMVLLVLIGFSKEIFIGVKDNFSTTFDRISRSLLLLFYPGFLSVFLIRILFFDQSTLLLLMLFLIVFGNDTFAYIFGMLFGKKNRNILAVSPNKSIAGFLGGLLVAVLISYLYVTFIPPMQVIFTKIEALLIGFVIAIISNFGDLIESVFKRGAKVKDSGKIILGRGGILDSIDSLLASVPFFVLFIILCS
jgi:phosphatidate cytidylyltransferase